MRIIFVILICCMTNAFAQSDAIINQSRFLQLENPSAFGLNFTNKVGVLYNTSTISQQNRLDNKYFFSAMAFRDQKFSLGIDLNSYKIYNTDLTSTFARLNFTYIVKTNNNSYFLPSITLGYNNVSFNDPRFIFEDQINQTTGYISTETLDPLGQRVSRINYPDFGASFLFHTEKHFLGMTFFHLNQPNTSFDKEGEEELSLELSFQGGVEFNINPYQRGFLPDNSFLFLYHSVRFSDLSTVYNLTQEVQLNFLSFSFSQRLSNVERFNLNAIGLGMGLAVENFDFGIQFNIPTRKINQVYAPSIFELYFSFDFSPFRRNNKGLHKRLQTDNY